MPPPEDDDSKCVHSLPLAPGDNNLCNCLNWVPVQLSCLRAEQAQLSRTLEKERQRAIENRQEYLAAAESSANQESRSKQLEEELEEVKKRYKLGLAEERAAREALEQVALKDFHNLFEVNR